MLWQRNDAEGDFLDHAKAALRPGNQKRQVHVPGVRYRFLKVIARKPPVHFREGGFDLIAPWGDFVMDLFIKLPHTIRAVHGVLGLGCAHRAGIEIRAIDQHRGHVMDVMAGFAINPRTLARTVRSDHAAHRGAACGRHGWREEIAMWFQPGIKLIQHHTGLDMHKATFGIKAQDIVEVFGGIENDGVVQRLAIGTGATPTRGDFDLGKFLTARKLHHHVDVIPRLGLQHGGWHHLIDAVIGRINQRGREIGMDFTAKLALGLQRFEEPQRQTIQRPIRGQGWQLFDHAFV